MKRLLALLLCLSLMLPVFALGEDDEEDIDFSELIEEDVDVDEEATSLPSTARARMMISPTRIWTSVKIFCTACCA